jgi:mevalonate kinase
VITYVKPVYFVRGQPIEALQVAQPFTILIGDTGISCPTAVTVGDVRNTWLENPVYYETLFDVIGQIAQQARQAIEAGHPEALGALMDSNHSLLQQLGVSSLELDRLVAAARDAGALGAKLSGGGRGGNMIALVQPADEANVEGALQNAGAVHVIATNIIGR